MGPLVTAVKTGATNGHVLAFLAPICRLNPGAVSEEMFGLFINALINIFETRTFAANTHGPCAVPRAVRNEFGNRHITIGMKWSLSKNINWQKQAPHEAELADFLLNANTCGCGVCFKPDSARRRCAIRTPRLPLIRTGSGCWFFAAKK